MPKLDSIQTNFTAGEISPKVRGRVDIARYQNGAEALSNMTVDIYGGASRAPGTAYVALAASASQRSRLIPFVLNRDTAYHLEFGHNVMRVFRAGAGQVLVGGVPYEISTPYSAAEVAEFRFAQGPNVMFIAHPSKPMQLLRRLADDSWVLGDVPFTVVPFSELGDRPSTNLTLSASTVGLGRTATASAATFLAADVGRRITYQTGIAVIKTVSSSTSATVDVTAPFPSTSLPSLQWILEDSPQTTCTPSVKGTVGLAISLSLAVQGWRDSDIGKFVTINRGLVQITTVASTTVATGVVKADMDAVTAAEAGAWTLQGPVWSVYEGYPAAVAINQQRLNAAGTSRFPNGVWGSRSGEYFDFTQGKNDGDGYFFPLDGESNGIEHLASVRALIALTPGTEWTLVGGVEKPLTPTNVNAKDQTVYGCNNVRPVRVGDELLFVQRAGRKVRAMSYQAASDSYSAPNLTTLSEHLTAAGVVDMAYQQEPGSLVWAVLGDGNMTSMTFDRDEGVIAWTPHDTDGSYESVSSAPAGATDEVLLVVRRVVNGQTVRYIERMSTEYFVHSGISGHNPAGAEVWTGLEHLEGKTVQVRADGTKQPDQVVIGGQITLPGPAVDVQIGLKVVPRVQLLRPEVGTPTGTAQASNMRTHKVSVLFYRTIGATINGQQRAVRSFGPGILDKPPAPLSGWDGVGNLGWDVGESPIEIIQDDPMPFHILAVVRHWTTNS
ncbi:hypothetical protein [Achromobacter sp. 2789STDY5608628]|uniref:hypothetical protein n=1 Tax=Achromobacter sp. 2789STDY5608628 TaxID=1806493 RepID=UPI0006C21B31|nr:hypothetical protein [Achromobacter sp. 2789STDY5608628]CUJ67420.1 Uncharacterised protein [Achromobacter sp. 2789STDY5608628]